MQTEVYVKEQVSENGLVLKDIEYEKKYTKKGLLVEGHYNNKQFRYMEPVDKKRVHFSRKNSNIVFNPVESIVRMPIYPVDSLIIHRKLKGKSKKRKTNIHNKKINKNRTMRKRNNKRRQ